MPQLWTVGDVGCWVTAPVRPYLMLAHHEVEVGEKGVMRCFSDGLREILAVTGCPVTAPVRCHLSMSMLS